LLLKNLSKYKLLMLRKYYLLLASILFLGSYSLAQTGVGTIRGAITDKNTKEPIPFANVVLYRNGNQVGGAKTDFDGKFQINSIEPGSYDVEFRYVGYASLRKNGVVVNSDRITFLNDIVLTASDKITEEVEVVYYVVPLIDKDGGASGQTVTREDIARMAVRSATEVAATVGGIYSPEGSDAISVRGSRTGDNYIFIDGIKVRGSSALPKSAIQEISVMTGGLPANYGDMTGGVISITTRGPSAKYFGSAEFVTSGFAMKGQNPLGYDTRVFGFDKFGYNLFEGMLSGPLLMKKDSAGNKTQPILGFFVSFNVTDEFDPRPVIGGTWRIKEDYRNAILDSPLRPTSTGQGTYHNSNFLRADAFENVPFRMNAGRTNYSGTFKLDANVGPNVTLTFGGQVAYNTGNQYSYFNSLMNWNNFGITDRLDYRLFGRFTHRLRFDDREGSSSKISSFFYSLMLDYSNSTGTTQDRNHRNNLFNYGYVGRFSTTRIPTYQFVDGVDENGNSFQYFEHDGFREVSTSFTPSDVNSDLAAITSQYYQLYANDPSATASLFDIVNGNALRNGDVPGNVYGIWGNVGVPFGTYSKFQQEQVRATGSATMNIGGHSVSLGFEFEQRVDRGYSAAPIRIWEVARQLANSHIRELDVNKPTWENFGTFSRVTYDRLNPSYGAANGVFGGQEMGDPQSFFDYNLRNLLGLNPFGTDFINLDEVDPNSLGFNLFSPDELFNAGNSFVSYFGYDHIGNKVRGATDINRYFNEFDENGNYKRNIGSFQPIYFAGYLMDKFAFDDIVFNVGVRVDYFNANQFVLKDPFLMYNARTVAEARVEEFEWVEIPESMGDNYVVYVNDINNPSQINGFRDGINWYDANGVPVADPSVIAGSLGIAPWVYNPGQTTPTADAFERYRPQINVMPRIAFSFPISDEASFFAHYDILTQRPNAGFRFDPFEYQFIQNRNAQINNPNLRPTTTIDYALGFQQVLTKTSAIKIETFYREMRNQIQAMRMVEAFPATYTTFGNRDFGTVKGLTLSYDLRRTGNIRLNANYTLQFAEGTGSNANSSLNLVNSGQPNLQTIFPLDFDRRHTFNFVIDYRYGEGKSYNGPKTKNGYQILKNTGVNLTTNVGSGTPYSRQQFATGEAIGVGTAGLEGTLNGSRQPWTYTTDLQIDRTFDLAFGKEEGKQNLAFLQIYFRVTNVFNQANVLNVYRGTGNPNDDGYLQSALFQPTIQNQLDERAFRDMYILNVANPFNFGLPRTIRLGIKFDF
jgi:hypothetical protein